MPNFNDILTGDRLFDSSNDCWNDAQLAPNQFARMVVMAAGYKEGADTLVQAAIDQRNRRDFFVYPIVFCYRQ